MENRYKEETEEDERASLEDDEYGDEIIDLGEEI